MLEEMRAEYDRSNEAFGVIVKAALSEIDCRENLKVELREAAASFYRMEWGVAVRAGLDLMFLEWLCGKEEPWLYSGDPIDHYLPRTVCEGVDFQLQSKEEKERSRGHARMAARDKRVSRAVEAITGGWAPEEAISFVASKEEWESVCVQTGIVRPMRAA